MNWVCFVDVLDQLQYLNPETVHAITAGPARHATFPDTRSEYPLAVWHTHDRGYNAQGMLFLFPTEERRRWVIERLLTGRTVDYIEPRR